MIEDKNNYSFQENNRNEQSLQLGGNLSLVNINESSIDITPSEKSIPSTPLLTNESIQEEKVKPKSLTRIRFFGSTYLWDKTDNKVYNDDVNNDEFLCIGTMQVNENNEPSRIKFT